MLIEFKVANFRSFHDEQTFTFVASKQDTSHPENLIPLEDGVDLLKSAAIYGPNASGKSNLIKAMWAMEGFVLRSATKMSLGDLIRRMAPFRLDSQSQDEPSQLEITVLLDGNTYIYGFSATTDRVHEEWLYVRLAGKRISKWIDRTYDASTGETSWKCLGELKKEEKLLRKRTRDNGLAFSRGAELNVEALEPLYRWFKRNFWLHDLSKSPMFIVQTTARRAKEDKNFRSFVEALMSDADTGISGLNVQEQPALKARPKNMPENLYAALKDFIGDEDATSYAVSTKHYISDTDATVEFDLVDDESNGTQRLFALAWPIFSALEDGDLLVIDELDCSMHPLLTRKIVELFNSEEANKKGAQLLFVTHDSSIMDSNILRRDQIWLTEKRQDGSTDLYSLFDIKSPRKNEALEKNYLSGKYGAIPIFGPVFEDLEFTLEEESVE